MSYQWAVRITVRPVIGLRLAQPAISVCISRARLSRTSNLAHRAQYLQWIHTPFPAYLYALTAITEKYNHSESRVHYTTFLGIAADLGTLLPGTWSPTKQAARAVFTR